MAAGMSALDQRFAFGNPLTVRDKARDFVLIDCAVWISRILSAVQRQDSCSVVHFASTMDDTLHELGATATIETLRQLELGCSSFGRAQVFEVCSLLMRDVTRLIDRLGAQLADPSWYPPRADLLEPSEIPTSPGFATIRRSCIASHQKPARARGRPARG